MLSRARSLTALPFYLVIIALALLGAFVPLDDALRDWRFGVHSRPATGEVVFVDIDSRSLDSVGVWPWPRQVHAEILDRLMALGADVVVFDIDFSVPSTPEGDAALEASLDAAGGYAYLAAFLQRDGAHGMQYNLPIERFRRFSEPVSVNVSLSQSGVVRDYPIAVQLGDQTIASAAALFAHAGGVAGAGFDIDYSIDASSIDRISVADLRAGQIDASRIAGKQVIVGASAVELRDFFVVPRSGILPGALLQAVAAETLKQGRALQPAGPLPTILLVLCIGLLSLTPARRTRLPVVIAGAVAVVIAVEVAALLLQLQAGLLLDTAAAHMAVAALLLQLLVAELVRRGAEKRKAEERLRYLGTHDHLTGTLSRTRLVELIAERLQRPDADVAVIIVDLRRFGAINDTLGHSQGDLLLKQVAGRLHSMGPDAVARLGGDNFAVMLPATDDARLKGFCEAVTQWLAVPYELAQSHKALIAASAGATTSLVSGRDPELLLSHADMALSATKRTAGYGVALYRPEMGERLAAKQAMDAALRNALARREFSLMLQPQTSLGTGSVVGAEALVRWNTDGLGMVSPDRFIPAAEETGLIVELGRWVLETACRAMAELPEHLSIAVNVSPVQFELSDVAADVTNALMKSGLAPHRLEIEITEGIFVRDASLVTKKLEALRALGVSVALDDFGTGYSSLSYLGKLPIDKIKIDQSFIKRLPDDPEAIAIVQAVMSVCRAHGKRVIAEGVETAAQARMLKSLGCDAAQGYHFGRPIPLDEFAELAAREHAAPPLILAASA